MALNEIEALLQRTGAGILECKKALIATRGDVDAAVEWLRGGPARKEVQVQETYQAEPKSGR